MNSIRTNRILPAYIENHCCFDKVEEYAKAMKENDINTGHHGFPPILGYYDKVRQEDIGLFFNYGSETNEELITEKYLGVEIFRVTDGNHRFLASLKAGIWILETGPDNSGFVNFKK